MTIPGGNANYYFYGFPGENLAHYSSPECFGFLSDDSAFNIDSGVFDGAELGDPLAEGEFDSLLEFAEDEAPQKRKSSAEVIPSIAAGIFEPLKEKKEGDSDTFGAAIDDLSINWLDLPFFDMTFPTDAEVVSSAVAAQPVMPGKRLRTEEPPQDDPAKRLRLDFPVEPIQLPGFFSLPPASHLYGPETSTLPLPGHQFLPASAVFSPVQPLQPHKFSSELLTDKQKDLADAILRVIPGYDAIKTSCGIDAGSEQIFEQALAGLLSSGMMARHLTNKTDVPAGLAPSGVQSQLSGCVSNEALEPSIKQRGRLSEVERLLNDFEQLKACVLKVLAEAAELGLAGLSRDQMMEKCGFGLSDMDVYGQRFYYALHRLHLTGCIAHPNANTRLWALAQHKPSI